MYSDIALDHFLNPRNVGIIEDADAFARVGDSSCGDFMEIFLKLDREREIVTDAKFRVFGCPGAIATSSVATELVKGKDFVSALSISDDDVIEALGELPDGKRHCSLLSITALRQALTEFIMREFAVSEGTVNGGGELGENYLVEDDFARRMETSGKEGKRGSDS
ncbi:MAG: iron-sulfur cluster assembly scaffold protein [Deltaproteobacteria bacterium]|uniref:Iron-sulfur cluster assembly scaffold protein n=1 Tax=Candidatus Zymogenus saltonus TaxID=2844893 RepID=A0A9D8KG28_9DELT|nr:iron-sulfur cluster assembly scaffold protein [Candidatus Zymogenus saltonus]